MIKDIEPFLLLNKYKVPDLFCSSFEEILVPKINSVFTLTVRILLSAAENILISFVGIVFIDSSYLLMAFSLDHFQPQTI